MSLPVLNIPARRSAGDLLRLFCRTEFLFSDTLAQPTALQSGTALANPHLPDIPAANRVFDAVIPAGWSANQAIAEVHAHFASVGTHCREWWPSLAEPSKPFASALLAAGYTPRAHEVLTLPSPSRPPDVSAENFSVFSARAALSHAAALAEEMTAGLPHPAQQAEAFLLHLDDPHYELLLAMQAREPIGMIGILAAGDLGRIDAPFVRTARRDHGVAELLLGRAIELCARSRFADVLTSGDANQEIFLAAGFRPIGQLTIHQTRSE